MKKTQIAMLIIVAAGIASLAFFFKDLTISTTFSHANGQYKDQFVHIAAKLDTTRYDRGVEKQEANSATFYASDSAGLSTKVVYNKELPLDFDKSNRLLLKGYMRDTYFDCKEIQLKCPSKYKDEVK